MVLVVFLWFCGSLLLLLKDCVCWLVCRLVVFLCYDYLESLFLWNHVCFVLHFLLGGCCLFGFGLSGGCLCA